jgi:UDP-N-acetyl-D-galactosamine dehydrogenase
VYESSTYPGCTEEDCVPVVEQVSGLRAGQGFQVGYSPERINPGDPEHRFATITKVVSAQSPEALERVARLYGEVVHAGIHRAPDIRTAEAAKIIENTQRDINIALMNELAVLFHRMGLNTLDVLRAAGTKWNFLRFTPGLVGGHCIPVDPYYLTYKAEQLGYFPQVILAGRRINDSMGRYVAQEAAKLLSRRGVGLSGARALVLGATFKEDVADARETRVVELVRELEQFGLHVEVHDPVLGPEGLRGIGLQPADPSGLAEMGSARGLGRFDLVVLAVPHQSFRNAGAKTLLSHLREPNRGVIVDVKGALDPSEVTADGAGYWRL